MTDFKVGDWVELLNDTYYDGVNGLRKGSIIPVVENLPEREKDLGYWISKRGVKCGRIHKLGESGDFKIVDCPTNEDPKEVIIPISRNVSEIARPILSERKVGKVPVHMVIDGFPRALREVGKVLGWAADAKQYKLHDWKNLPDAGVEFPSAGYRHMLDNSEMKSGGIAAIDRVDHESHKLHLAHEIFNKLAELELVLTGVIK